MASLYRITLEINDNGTVEDDVQLQKVMAYLDDLTDDLVMFFETKGREIPGAEYWTFETKD